MQTTLNSTALGSGEPRNSTTQARSHEAWLRRRVLLLVRGRLARVAHDESLLPALLLLSAHDAAWLHGAARRCSGAACGQGAHGARDSCRRALSIRRISQHERKDNNAFKRTLSHQRPGCRTAHLGLFSDCNTQMIHRERQHGGCENYLLWIALARGKFGRYRQTERLFYAR